MPWCCCVAFLSHVKEHLAADGGRQPVHFVREKMSTPQKPCQLALVTTTIYVPKALRAYMQNAKEHNKTDVLFVVTKTLVLC